MILKIMPFQNRIFSPSLTTGRSNSQKSHQTLATNSNLHNKSYYFCYYSCVKFKNEIKYAIYAV